jgi:glycerol-3-phosphate dehydrogenase (NAD(P)+)
MGLSGVGDLVLTCTDNQSRNRRVGLALAQGQSAEQAVASLGQVAEGVVTARAVRQLAARLGVSMPICGEVYRVLYEQRDPHAAVLALLAREPAAEF